MTEKNAGADFTDEQAQNREREGIPSPEKEGKAEKDNHVKVKIKTGGKNKEEIMPDPENESERLKEALEAAEKEKEDISNRLLRAAADFDNYKKRMDRQWADFKKYANESMAKDLLTVVDNLERAIAAAEETGEKDSGLVEGVKMTLADTLKILERQGVTPINSAGEKFDPNFHQAVSTQPVEGTESNIVLEEYQKGYMMHDRLLRPAMVVVSAPAPQDQGTK